MLKYITALQKAKRLNDEMTFVANRIGDKDWRMLLLRSTFHLVLSIADQHRDNFTHHQLESNRILEECKALLYILGEMKVISTTEFEAFDMSLQEIKNCLKGL